LTEASPSIAGVPHGFARGPVRVTHVITGLPRGGAQTVLSYLVRCSDPARFSMRVISLTETAAVGNLLAASGVSVRALGLNRAVPDPIRLARLVQWLRQDHADLVQTWLYHGDLIGGVAARVAGIPVLWNIRQTDLDPATTRRSTIWTARACARLSRSIPARIVCCSHASQRVHGALGYDTARMVVLPNGVDLDRFRPDAEARLRMRRAWGVPPDAKVVGAVARFHPQKDHETLVRAAGALLQRMPEVHFVLCGENVDQGNAALSSWIAATGRRDRFHLLGIRDDVPAVTAAFDVATCTSSYGEGFNNVLVEAMACGVPCVTTDVGDAAAIVGGLGWVVRPREVDAIAAAWQQALGDGERRATAVRRRATEDFSLASMIRRYEDLYESLTARP
jgi:glycosyltransferase involved in cell wall biosynthesis